MESTRTPSPTEIMDQLDRVLHSTPFANANRSQRFLRYIVETSLNNRHEFLKEFAIAVDVFGRNVSYDPSINATVRVEAGRLRSRLRDYYADEGLNDSVIIDVPKGGYRAIFTGRSVGTASAVGQVAAAPATETRPPIQKAAWRRLVPPVVLGAIILFVAVGGIALWKKPASHNLGSGQKVLAVLPFSNQTGSDADSLLTEGITETLIREFSRIPQLRVMSRAAVESVNKQNAASQFGVGYLLTGDLRRSVDGRLVLNAELIDAKNGTVLHRKKYIPDESDPRRIQADIFQDALKGLGISPDVGQLRSPARRPDGLSIN